METCWIPNTETNRVVSNRQSKRNAMIVTSAEVISNLQWAFSSDHIMKLVSSFFCSFKPQVFAYALLWIGKKFCVQHVNEQFRTRNIVIWSSHGQLLSTNKRFNFAAKHFNETFRNQLNLNWLKSSSGGNSNFLSHWTFTNWLVKWQFTRKC